MPGTYRSPAETEFYYLTSRYYAPVTCRFINADSILGANQDVLGYNIFSYCSNSPINFYDSTGKGKLLNKIKSKAKEFLKSFVSEYNSVNSEKSIAVSSAIITGKNIDIGKGWKVRIDKADNNTHTQKHIHVEKGNLKYSQNEDGSKHDGNSTKGSPPKSVRKKIKNDLGWDWDGKLEKFQSEHGIDLTDDPVYGIFFCPTDVGSLGPIFQTSPSPSTSPVISFGFQKVPIL